MTRVVISQPMYFPWAGFVAQMSLADVMIWLDDATFSKGSFTNRIQVKTPTGRTWMTIPLVGKGSGVTIRDLEASDPSIRHAHRALVANTWRRAPHCADALETFGRAWQPDAPLVETLIASAEAVATEIGLPARVTRRSAEMKIGGTGSDRVLALVRAAGGTEYITGHGAREYLDHAAFDAAGIAVRYMDYAVRPWPQDHGPFTPYVTALDLISHVPAVERAAHLAPRTVDWQTFLGES
ncbi:WbqC family protein [uncultured Jannaschia sp.]|uniref:WbqC family protein n=1 Tax=uncultured Jannaschia sp. TaxID=293347 RepID=UPI00261729ED|nr:WbqC family protein [uncultured Jannaschia sp.]